MSDATKTVDALEAEVTEFSEQLVKLVDEKRTKEAELTELHARISELEKRRSFAKMQIMQHQKGGSVPEKHESGQVTDHSVWNRSGYFWEEKNLMSWLKKRLDELFVDKEIPIDGGAITVTEVSRLEGDATCNVRRGRRIVGFELEVELKCRAVLRDGDGNELVAADGTFSFPEVSNDVDDDEEYEVEVKLEGDSSGHARAKEAMRSAGVREVQRIMTQATAELIAMGSSE